MNYISIWSKVINQNHEKCKQIEEKTDIEYKWNNNNNEKLWQEQNKLNRTLMHVYKVIEY